MWTCQLSCTVIVITSLLPIIRTIYRYWGFWNVMTLLSVWDLIISVRKSKREWNGTSGTPEVDKTLFHRLRESLRVGNGLTGRFYRVEMFFCATSGKSGAFSNEMKASCDNFIELKNDYLHTTNKYFTLYFSCSCFNVKNKYILLSIFLKI